MRPEEKIYKAYFKSKKSTLYFNEIKEITQLSDSSLSNVLTKLTKGRVLSREKTKSNTFYKIQDKKIFELKFSEIAMQRFNELNTNIKIPLKNFLKEFPKKVYTIVLFGSASKKQESDRSDIDILVIIDKKVNINKHKREAEITSRHPISVFSTKIKDFLENKDDVVVQARKTGFPIYKQQNFYEAILDEY
jgi:predicted nucleotidyltransferase